MTTLLTGLKGRLKTSNQKAVGRNQKTIVNEVTLLTAHCLLLFRNIIAFGLR